MTRRALLLGAAAVAVAIAAAGCGPWFYAASTPPPTKTARLDTGKDRIVISAGVALAFTCDKGRPCRDARATVEDERIATVRRAHLDELHPAPGSPYYPHAYGMEPATAFVVVGLQPGTTTIEVRSRDGDETLRVEVVP